jgi:signal peptidase II
LKKAFFSAVLLIVVDAMSKFFAQQLPPAGVFLFDCLGVRFSLDFVTNTGVAWGLFQGFPLFLLLLRVGIIAGFIFYLFSNRTLSIPFLLILSGAIGNVIDLVCYGHVIDFLHVCFFKWSFPVFNFADSCISVGAALLLFSPRKKHVNV